VPRARRRPVELRQQLQHPLELGFVVGVVADVQLTAQHPLSHLAHPPYLPRDRAEAAGTPGDLEKSGGCRIGAVLFVVGLKPPTTGGAEVKEPRS
jgi:hypothetical protein